MAITLEEFVSRITENGLLSADDVDAIRNELGRESDTATLVDRLVSRGKLTRYQSRILLNLSYEPLVLGDYVILDLLGQGGMGKVFKAEHRQMERIVALKMLPAEDLADDDAVNRFKREIKAAAKLVHPHIVTAYDARFDNNARYLICEFIDGCDLTTLVRKKGPLDVRTAIKYVVQAARGLDHAHRQGIVHRDVKPSNLMLTKTGIVKILDLGLAQFTTLFGSEDVVSTVTELTAAGDVVGTVDYMAPEQAADSRHVDLRADIYSLGCTLFFLLAGRPPFEKGSIVERLLAHQQKEFPRIGDYRPEVPDSLDEVLKRMVARNPNDRVQQMSDVIEMLEGVIREDDSRVGNARSGQDDRGGDARDDPSTDFAIGTDIPADAKTEFQIARKKLPATVLLSPSQRGPINTHTTGRSKMIRYGLAALALCMVTIFIARQFTQNPKPATNQPAPAAEVSIDEQTSDDNGTDGASGTDTEANTNGDIETELNAELAFVTTDSIRDRQASWAKRLELPVTETGDDGLVMVLIPPGKLQLEPDSTSTTDTKSAEFASMEIHSRPDLIVIEQPYYCSAHEISRRQFYDMLNFDPSQSLGLEQSETSMSRPVETVSWINAASFCNAMSEKSGLKPYYEIQDEDVVVQGGNGYRLPTENEWEFACRAGSATVFSFGNDHEMLNEYGWYANNSMYQTQPIGEKFPNRLGLYDMHGNVYEWCEDVVLFKPNMGPETKQRIVRGGSWTHPAGECSSSSRYYYGDVDKGPNGGFRVVRTIESSSATVRRQTE